jgi:hypothetical protein
MLPEHNSKTDRQRRLYRKIAALEKKKARCLKYSSTPNQCHAYHARLVSRVRGRLKIMNLKRGVRKLKGKIRKRRPAREGLLNEYLNYLNEAGFETKPKGWTEKSVKKSATTLAKGMGLQSARDKGFFEKCVKKMKKHMGNPEGYCASLKDEAYDSTYWRGKDKTKKQAIKMTSMHKNV